MKIRSINFGCPGIPERVEIAAAILNSLKSSLCASGVEVQQLRVSLPYWNPGARKDIDLAGYLTRLNENVVSAGIGFCSLGLVRDNKSIQEILSVLPELKSLNACVDVADATGGIHYPALSAAANAIYSLSHSTDPFTNFRFGAGACLVPHSPYFPGAFHEGAKPSFSIGLENSDALIEAFSVVGRKDDLRAAATSLANVLTDPLKKIEKIASEAARGLSVEFAGIDTSIAPSLRQEESIVKAFSQLGIEFGQAGTLAVCSVITDTIKAIPVRKVGYCGLMLPIMEDHGLAEFCGTEAFDLQKLLAYSSVCGVGIDMVPVANASPDKLERIILDVASMSMRLRKPLLTRLLPVNSGGLTDFNSPFILNARAVPV